MFLYLLHLRCVLGLLRFLHGIRVVRARRLSFPLSIRFFEEAVRVFVRGNGIDVFLLEGYAFVDL